MIGTDVDVIVLVVGVEGDTCTVGDGERGEGLYPDGDDPDEGVCGEGA